MSHGDFTLILKDGTELTLSRAYRSQIEGWLRHAAQPGFDART